MSFRCLSAVSLPVHFAFEHNRSAGAYRSSEHEQGQGREASSAGMKQRRADINPSKNDRTKQKLVAYERDDAEAQLRELL